MKAFRCLALIERRCRVTEESGERNTLLSENQRAPGSGSGAQGLGWARCCRGLPGAAGRAARPGPGRRAALRARRGGPTSLRQRRAPPSRAGPAEPPRASSQLRSSRPPARQGKAGREGLAGPPRARRGVRVPLAALSSPAGAGGAADPLWQRGGSRRGDTPGSPRDGHLPPSRCPGVSLGPGDSCSSRRGLDGSDLPRAQSLGEASRGWSLQGRGAKSSLQLQEAGGDPEGRSAPCHGQR